MPPGTLTKQVRKLTEKIDGRDVYARDLVNDDLDAIDEITDDWSELQRRMVDLARDIDQSDDPEQRKQLRAQVRELKREQRKLDEQMLSRYVEDNAGEPFAPEAIATTPVRIHTTLISQASKLTHGGSDDEGPTPAASDGR